MNCKLGINDNKDQLNKLDDFKFVNYPPQVFYWYNIWMSH